MLMLMKKNLLINMLNIAILKINKILKLILNIQIYVKIINNNFRKN